MKTIYLGISFLLTLVACNSSKMNFNSMSSEELAAYNQTVSTWEQIICREQEHIRSRIPRRRCDTRLHWQNGVVNEVNVLGTAVSGQQQIDVN